MVEAKAGNASKDGRKTDAATSGKNAAASATSKNGNGAKETTKSWTEEQKDGPIVKKFFTKTNADSDSKSDDSWTLFGDNTSTNSKNGDNRAKSSGNGAVASAGKSAFAGIVNGKAVATTK